MAVQQPPDDEWTTAAGLHVVARLALPRLHRCCDCALLPGAMVLAAEVDQSSEVDAVYIAGGRRREASLNAANSARIIPVTTTVTPDTCPARRKRSICRRTSRAGPGATRADSANALV